MNNTLIAKVLHTNGLATKEQIQAYWALSNDERDIGRVLVDQGILSPQVYEQVIAFVAKMTQPVGQAPTGSVAPAPQEQTGVSPEVPRVRVGVSIGAKSSENPHPPAEDSVPSGSGAFAIEGNNPFGEVADEETQSTAPLEGLQETRLADFTPIAAEREKTRLAYDWVLEYPVREAPSKVASLVPGVSAPLDSLLLAAKKQGIGEIRLAAGQPVLVKREERWSVWFEETPGAADLRRWLHEAMNQAPGMSLRDRAQPLCVVISYPGIGLFRVASVPVKSGSALAIRALSAQIPAWQSLNIPEACRAWLEPHRDLLIIAGIQGSGVTTLALALAWRCAEKYGKRVHWIADPLEWVPQDQTAPFHAYQPRLHGVSMEECIRQIPEGLLAVDGARSVAERVAFLEQVSYGRTAILTVSAFSAVGALRELTRGIAEERRRWANAVLARHLRGVICRQWRAGEQGQKIPAYEYMKVNPRMRELLARGDYAAIPAAIAKNESALLDDWIRRPDGQGAL